MVECVFLEEWNSDPINGAAFYCVL